MMIIADEAHMIKKPGAAQSRFARTLAKRCQWKLALTGTPIDEGFEQYWAVFDFIGKNEIFGTYGDFKERYIIFEERQRRDKRKYPVIVGYRYDDEIMEKIHA
jgi:SNF2 family DNA or RNA helicase